MTGDNLHEREAVSLPGHFYKRLLRRAYAIGRAKQKFTRRPAAWARRRSRWPDLSCRQKMEASSFQIKADQARLLQYNASNKAWNNFTISRPQPTRLGHETKQPFETGALHEVWGLRLCASVKVKGSPDPNEEGWIKAITHFRHPLLLLGSAETDPDEMRLIGVNHGNVLIFLAGAQGAERRSIASAHFQTWKALLQDVAKLFPNAVVAAIEE